MNWSATAVQLFRVSGTVQLHAYVDNAGILGFVARNNIAPKYLSSVGVQIPV